ncbi:hypothetical protein [uncultured Tateyamaria sp.]|uniref:hypothetical protein n=1 Tax=uncultured Tateyamaria sp. TaxID=455651 RepID=UPI002624F96A|nr:hypothetical protein [uncultured Tateyamaria sp.]
MSKTLSAFRPVDGADGLVHSARKGNLRCTAIRLRDGGLCLYSPVAGLGMAARDSLEALGPVAYLLAPNHYHHKGLAEYCAAFPDAQLICSTAARPRLETQTSLSFAACEDADLGLPPLARVVVPNGLKTGEIWIALRTGSDMIWIVTDAFCGEQAASDTVSDAPRLLGTFPRFGIGDRSAYRAWLAGQVATAAPTRIIPCHGSIIHGDALGAQALQLIDALG